MNAHQLVRFQANSVFSVIQREKSKARNLDDSENAQNTKCKTPNGIASSNTRVHTHK